MVEYICTEGPCHNKPFKTNDRTKIKGHIAAKHLNYFPYVCGICDDEGSELAAPTLKHLQTHSKEFHPGQTQKTKLCLDDDKDEILEKWIERIKQHSEEASEIQGSAARGQHCETPSDTTVSNEIAPEQSLNSLPSEVQFPTSNPPESFSIPEIPSFPTKNLENVNFQPENSAINEPKFENVGILNEAIIVNTQPMVIEQQNVLQLPVDNILDRFLKQEQISTPELIDISSSDSPGFVVTEASNTCTLLFPEMTSMSKQMEMETKTELNGKLFLLVMLSRRL